MRFLALLLLTIPASAQTVEVPPLKVAIPPLVSQLPAVMQPAQTVSCPVTGKTANCKIPAQTLLKASQTTTAPTSTSTTSIVIPVTSTPKTYTFSCTGTDLAHLSCTASKQ